jgi:hypothetical protein
MFGRLEVEIHRWYYDHDLQETIFAVIPYPEAYVLVPTTQEIYNLPKLMSYEINCFNDAGRCSIRRNWPSLYRNLNISHAEPVLLNRLAQAEMRWLDTAEACAAVTFLAIVYLTLKVFETALCALGTAVHRLVSRNADSTDINARLNNELALMVMLPHTVSFHVYLSMEDTDLNFARMLVDGVLEPAGFTVCFPHRDIRPGVPELSASSLAISYSRKSLLLMSHDYLQEKSFEAEMIVSHVLDDGRRVKDCVLVLWLSQEPVCLPSWLTGCAVHDWSAVGQIRRADHVPHLLRARLTCWLRDERLKLSVLNWAERIYNVWLSV